MPDDDYSWVKIEPWYPCRAETTRIMLCGFMVADEIEVEDSTYDWLVIPFTLVSVGFLMYVMGYFVGSCHL